jgi:hypothetical protein
MARVPSSSTAVKASCRLSGDQAKGPRVAICAAPATATEPETTVDCEPSLIATTIDAGVLVVR